MNIVELTMILPKAIFLFGRDGIFVLLSKLLGERYKEKPNEAAMTSHIFLLRGGYVRQVANGIFSMLMPAKRVAKKIEGIIRQQMDKIDGQEVMFPVVLPAELWRESGRFESVGSELMRMKDRSGHDMLLGMTHEEAAVHLARSEAKSYLKYPFMIYQIQTKFRDEPRSRGGLIRVREFTMKDAYSFHTSQKDLEEYYDKALHCYERIFERAGLTSVISVSSDSGMMGGNMAHEFMFLSDDGEDSLVLCASCGYKSNMEVASGVIKKYQYKEGEVKEVYTPAIKDIDSLSDFLGLPPQQIMKAVVYTREDNKKPLIVFIRGDLQVNEAKVKKVVCANIAPLANYEDANLTFGSIGAYKFDTTQADVLFDCSLEGGNNFACGANKYDYHITGVSMERDIKPERYHDFAKVGDGDLCMVCAKPLKVKRGIEVGNIFQLGNKYTKGMNMTYTDENGKQQYPIMGCYGIGVGRLLACIMEEHHDDYGPIWPISVAPWQIHICCINNNIEEVWSVSKNLYESLSQKYEVIMDDRSAGAGVQFADADLLGVPVRVIVSKRNVLQGVLEITTRDKSVKMTVAIESAMEEIEKVIQDLMKRNGDE